MSVEGFLIIWTSLVHPVGPDTKNCMSQGIVSCLFVSTDMLKKVRQLPDSVSNLRVFPSGVISVL